MVKYLKLKNKVFRKIFMQLYKSGELREALYYLDGEDRYTDYYDLVGLYFRDEEGYQRSLFLPVPLLTGKMRKILFDSLGNYHIVSREWHDDGIKDKPYQNYPEHGYSTVESADEEEVEEVQ